MKKIMIYLLLSVMTISLFGGTVFAEEMKTIQVSVDPRMELLSVVQLLSGYGDQGILTPYKLFYKNEMLDYFEPYAEHKAVTMFAQMSKKGYSFDAPPATMLYVSNPPELKKEIPFTDYLKKRAGGTFGGRKLDQFIAALRDFAKDSNFMEFYEEHQDFYDQIVAETIATMGDANHVQTLEDYYGMAQNSYNIILTPIFHPGGYGPRVERADGIYDLYNIMGPTEHKIGHPVFGSEAEFRRLVWHEFGHSFVNPQTEAHGKEVNRSQSLYGPIADAMIKQSYGSWQTAVNEHLVRAVTTRLSYLHLGEDAGKAAQMYEKSKSFAYLEELLAALESYEAKRDQYPTFKDFYPELVKVFDQLAGQELGTDRFDLPFNGSINSAIQANVEGIVIILPTNEADPAVQEKIYEYVENFKKNIFPDNEMITDKEALERDFSDKVPLLFGTMEGNLFLKKYADQLPFTIGTDQITVMDQVFEGTELELLTAVRNVFNDEAGMLIFTAQQAEDVVKINTVYHGPTGYVVVEGTKIIKSGNYQ